MSKQTNRFIDELDCGNEHCEATMQRWGHSLGVTNTRFLKTGGDLHLIILNYTISIRKLLDSPSWFVLVLSLNSHTSLNSHRRLLQRPMCISKLPICFEARKDPFMLDNRSCETRIGNSFGSLRPMMILNFEGSSVTKFDSLVWNWLAIEAQQDHCNELSEQFGMMQTHHRIGLRARPDSEVVDILSTWQRVFVRARLDNGDADWVTFNCSRSGNGTSSGLLWLWVVAVFSASEIWKPWRSLYWLKLVCWLLL